MASLVPALTKFRSSRTPKLTLETLADLAGVTTGHLSRVERFGTANFKLAIRLQQITGLPVETFAPRPAALAEAV